MAAGFNAAFAPRVDRDQPEHLAGRAVAVHVLVGVHADPIRRRHGAKGRAPLAERARDPVALPAPGAARATGRERRVGRLPHRAEAQHVAAEARGDRHGGCDDRPSGPGQVAAAVDPGRVDPERLLDGGGAALAHPHAAGARIGRQPVDVLQREPGVGDRLEAGVDGQREGIDHEPPPDLRPPDAAEDGAMLEALAAERRAGDGTLRLARPGRPGRRTRSARTGAARRPRAARSGR